MLANRGGTKTKAQVWKVPLDGKPEKVTDVKAGVVAYDYAPKADTIFFTADATATDDDDFSTLRKKYEKIEHGHGKRDGRLAGIRIVHGGPTDLRPVHQRLQHRAAGQHLHLPGDR